MGSVNVDTKDIHNKLDYWNCISMFSYFTEKEKNEKQMCFLSIYLFMCGYVSVCLHLFTREPMSHLRKESVQVSRYLDSLSQSSYAGHSQLLSVLICLSSCCTGYKYT